MYIGISAAELDLASKKELSGVICVIDDSQNIIQLLCFKERRKEDFYKKVVDFIGVNSEKNRVGIDMGNTLLIKYVEDNNLSDKLISYSPVESDNNAYKGIRITKRSQEEIDKLVALNIINGKNEFIKPLVLEYLVFKNNEIVEAFSMALAAKNYSSDLK